MKKEIIPTITEKEWNVPRALSKDSTIERIVQMLGSINRINDTNSYYIRDFRSRKIIVDSDTSAILCGYSKSFVDKEGFSFYQHILAETDSKWIRKAYRDSFRIFHKYPKEDRKCLTVLYYAEVRTANNERLILRHKATPYLLCDHGNLWLSLCCVSILNQREPSNATITNTETGECYEFLDGEFVLSESLAITQEDIMFLKGLCNGLSNMEISVLLDITERSLARKRLKLLKKLGAKSTEQAIHKAHLMGLI